tara:strand:+ start:674 stop:973 length:300 start_codon:yes stop_codon:yes gene_type:complete
MQREASTRQPVHQQAGKKPLTIREEEEARFLSKGFSHRYRIIFAYPCFESYPPFLSDESFGNDEHLRIYSDEEVEKLVFNLKVGGLCIIIASCLKIAQI